MSEKNFVTYENAQSVVRNIGNKLADIADTAETIVYGWHYDGGADPSESVTYLEDAAGMTPAFMDFSAGKFNYGSWENAFFMPKPCMLKFDGTVDYYLDPDDYSKKADGTPSDIANENYAGNVMMEWPLLYWKYVPDSYGNYQPGYTGGSFYISNRCADNKYHPWCNIDNNGDYTDHFYTAVYPASNISVDGESYARARSLSGRAASLYNSSSLQIENNQTTVPIAKNNLDYAGEGQYYSGRLAVNRYIWSAMNFGDYSLITGLLVLMGKSLDSQSVYGTGVEGTRANYEYISGSANDKGLFWGADDHTSVVKIFGMENFWGGAGTHLYCGDYTGSAGYYSGKLYYIPCIGYGKETYGNSISPVSIGLNFNSNYPSSALTEYTASGYPALSSYGFCFTIHGILPCSLYAVFNGGTTGSSSTYFCDTIHARWSRSSGMTNGLYTYTLLSTNTNASPFITFGSADNNDSNNSSGLFSHRIGRGNLKYVPVQGGARFMLTCKPHPVSASGGD